jgi:membrane-associated phospholipid phosphatase
VVGRAFDAPRVSQLGGELIRAQIVSQSITQSVKFVTTRTRPDGTPLSLPSGHTASAFATATVLQSNFGWKVGAPAYAAAVWIGASRVQMKRHFVSDVVAGAAVGLVAGRSVTIGRGDFRFAVTPMAASGGAGVNFVRLTSR